MQKTNFPLLVKLFIAIAYFVLGIVFINIAVADEKSFLLSNSIIGLPVKTTIGIMMIIYSAFRLFRVYSDFKNNKENNDE
ncbi:MAG: hypothetical protein KA313_10955 [Pseudarcicella sp.]|nr:hypothetical protein [Pseudarcicella sp.]MBP6411609.1 hypothetical protein [Pseudarcicella sp.]